MKQATQTYTLRITGTIRAVTPISYQLPKTPRMEPLHVFGQGGAQDRLYLTASSLRSAVRHGATELVSSLIGKKPSLQDYFLMALGGVKDGKDDKTKKKPAKGMAAKQDDDDMAEESGDDGGNEDMAKALSGILKTQFARQKNPMVTLFGSMSHGIPGALMCAHATAPEGVKADTFRFVRANDFQRDPDLAGRLDESAMADYAERQRLAAIRSAAKSEQKVLKREIQAARKAGSADRIEELNGQIVAVGDGGSKAIQISQPDLNYDAIPAGVVFEHKFMLCGVSEMEIALFIQGLDRFGLSPFIGGKRNHGLGQIAMDYSVLVRKDGERTFRDMGNIAVSEDMDGVRAQGEIARYLDVEMLAAPIRDGALDFSEASIAACAPASKSNN